ncbi:MAG: GGDEF domain-containing protein [Gallionella sp.]
MNATDRALIEQNQLFHGMDIANVEYMLEYCSERNLAAGECLLQPDEPNHFIYLIFEGKLGVHLASPKPLAPEILPPQTKDVDTQSLILATLSVGECVGELSLVDGMPPSALVVATVPTRVLSIPHDTVWSLVDQSHVIAKNLLHIFASRLRSDNRALIDSRTIRKRFQQQASVDALTGLHNRHWMMDAFPRTMHRCLFNKNPFAIMMCDIDHFKRVNDTHGHLAGDIALQIVARCMTKHLRPHDLMVRYGGEEFSVLLPDTDSQQANIAAERLRTAIADTAIHGDDFSFQVTISIGITSTQHEEKLETLIGKADQALYRAKEQGRNRVVIFD